MFPSWMIPQILAIKTGRGALPSCEIILDYDTTKNNDHGEIQ